MKRISALVLFITLLFSCSGDEFNIEKEGGHEFTLKASAADFLIRESSNSENELFIATLQHVSLSGKHEGEDFIRAFVTEWNKKSAGKTGTVFMIGHPDEYKSKMSEEELTSVLVRQYQKAMDNTVLVLKARVEKFGCTKLKIFHEGNTIKVQVGDVKDPLRMRKLLQAYGSLYFYETYQNYETYPYFEKANTILSLRLRSEQDSLKQSPSDRASLSDSPEISNEPEEHFNEDSIDMIERYPLFRFLQLSVVNNERGYPELENSARIGTCKIRDTANQNKLLNHPVLASVWPKDMKFVWAVKPENIQDKPIEWISLYVIKENDRKLSGEGIKGANSEADMSKNPSVSFQFDEVYTEKWRKMTQYNVNRFIAMVYDGYAYSVPMVHEEISGGNCQISGNFTLEETTDLAAILNAGVMPLRLTIIDEKVVSAKN